MEAGWHQQLASSMSSLPTMAVREGVRLITTSTPSRLLEFTRQMMTSSGGAVAGNIWHTATHAEHARPMLQARRQGFKLLLLGVLALVHPAMLLQFCQVEEHTSASHPFYCPQVSGDAFLQCLNVALDAAPNMHQALQVRRQLLVWYVFESTLRSEQVLFVQCASMQRPAFLTHFRAFCIQVLGGYEQAVRLAALLRLEGLCEALVAGLAAAAGLSAPAPHSSAAEAKQVGRAHCGGLDHGTPLHLECHARVHRPCPWHQLFVTLGALFAMHNSLLGIAPYRWLRCPSWCPWARAARQACWARAGSSCCAR